MATPITWKNVGATISGDAAGETMEGGVKTAMGAFDPLQRLRREAQDISDQNYEQGGVNLNLEEQARQKAGSLLEYNQMKASGQFDDAAAKERLGVRYDPVAAEAARTKQQADLRTTASGEAMAAGETAGDEASSSLAGTQAYEAKLRELGASEEYIKSSAANYMKDDVVNQAQYKAETEKVTDEVMRGKKFGSNAEIEEYIAEQKGIHGNSFDGNRARSQAQSLMKGGFDDEVRDEAKLKKVRTKALDQVAGKIMTDVTAGKSLDEIKQYIATLPEDQREDAYARAQAIESSINSMTATEKIDHQFAVKQITHMGIDLKERQASELGILDAQIEALDLAPSPEIQGAVAKLNATMGVGSGVEATYEKGLAAGIVNALWAGPDMQTGTKVGDTVRIRLDRLLLDGGLTRDEAAGIIFTAEQFARRSGGAGTMKFDNKTFEAMVSKMNRDVLAAKKLKVQRASKQSEHMLQNSGFRTAAAAWERDSAKSLLGSGKTKVQPFGFTVNPSKGKTPETDVNTEAGKVIEGVGGKGKTTIVAAAGQTVDPPQTAIANRAAEIKLLKSVKNVTENEVKNTPNILNSIKAQDNILKALGTTLERDIVKTEEDQVKVKEAIDKIKASWAKQREASKAKHRQAQLSEAEYTKAMMGTITKALRSSGISDYVHGKQ
jgi:hypothetical protein